MSTRGRAFGLPLMLVLAACFALTPYTVDTVLPVFPAAAAALGVPPSGIQATMTSYLAGVACGQLVFGPFSDRFGRRVPLLVGVAVTVIGGLAAALAPDVGILLAARAVQGLGASSTMVISRAVVRDLTHGSATVRALSTTTAISGAAAIGAPVVGGVLGDAFGWRAPLWFLVVLAAGVLLACAWVVRETLPAEARSTRERWHPAHYGRPFRDGAFARYALVQACSTASMMAYVAASPFLYQSILGFPAWAYGALFAVNAAVAVVVNLIVNHRFGHIDSHRIVRIGFAVALAGVGASALSLALSAPPALVAACVTVSMCTFAMNGPNVVSLALNRVHSSVGTAAASIGFVQFLTGALVSPVVGLAGASSQVIPLALMALGCLSGIVVIGRGDSRGR